MQIRCRQARRLVQSQVHGSYGHIWRHLRSNFLRLVAKREKMHRKGQPPAQRSHSGLLLEARVKCLIVMECVSCGERVMGLVVGTCSHPGGVRGESASSTIEVRWWLLENPFCVNRGAFTAPCISALLSHRFKRSVILCGRDITVALW